MKKIFGSLFILLAFLGCKEKYISPVASPNLGYLVVEGTINSGTGITQIVLKRTVKLDNPIIVYEQGAIVTVDGQDNSKAFLTETSLGHYTAANLNLNSAKQYRLNIITKDGKVYQSDYASSQNTPAIDSVSWKQDASGIQLFVNSHDASGLNKYYQWDYTETWEYHSPNKQFFVYQQIPPPTNKWGLVYFDPILISFNAAIYSCWPTTNSTNIILGSSITLTDNKISLPLVSIPTGDVKVGILYSIDTRQYGLSEAKYNYLQKMKKNTEGTGSVFDAQPSELVGNIHCTTNASEPVVGYIDICNIQEIRTFIRNDQLPNWNYVSPCKPVELLNNIKTIDSTHGILLPLDVAKYSPFGGILSYYFDMPNCVDCSFFGSNIKPPFWP